MKSSLSSAPRESGVLSIDSLLRAVLTPALLATLLSTGRVEAQTPHGVVLLETMKREGKTDFSPAVLSNWKSGKTGIFNLTASMGDWSESVTGAIYAPTDNLQLSLGAGFEKTRGKDPTARFAFIVSYSKENNNLFLVLEKGEKTPLEHRVFVAHKVNDVLSLGATSRVGRGSGPYARFDLTKNAALTTGVEIMPHRGANYFMQGVFSF